VSRLDDVLADIQRRVAQRRAAGDYPPDLEQRLAAHTARTGGLPAGDLSAVHAALDALAAARRFDAGRIATTSKSRAGAAAHRAVALAVARQTGGILAQVGEFADRVETALRLVVERLEAPAPATLLAAQLDTVLDQLARDGQPLDDQGALADLRVRLEVIESETRPFPSATWWDAVRWVETLDGPFDEVVAVRGALADRMHGPVLDVSCRRGELLWALGERGIEATGADAEARLAAVAAGAGLAVVHGGPMLTLARTEEASLGAVAALGAIGRLGSQGAADLVALAVDRLQAGGHLLIEAPEPGDPAMWADPTAGVPVPSAWIEFACHELRFRTVAVERAADAPAGARPGCYLVTATK
jgi:SAM-dependent methyltransferase